MDPGKGILNHFLYKDHLVLAIHSIGTIATELVSSLVTVRARRGGGDRWVENGTDLITRETVQRIFTSVKYES